MAFLISKPVLTLQVTNFRILQHSKTSFHMLFEHAVLCQAQVVPLEFAENSQESSIILNCIVLN